MSFMLSSLFVNLACKTNIFVVGKLEEIYHESNFIYHYLVA